MLLACTVRGMPGKDHNTPDNSNVEIKFIYLLENLDKNLAGTAPILQFQKQNAFFIKILYFISCLATLLLPFIFPAPWHPEIDRF